MKIKNILYSGALCAAVALSQRVSADARCSLYGQALYLKPTGGGQIFAQGVGGANTINSPITPQVVCPDYSWGYEIGARMATQCGCTYYMQLSSGWIESVDTSNNSGNFLLQLPLFGITNASLPRIVGRAEGGLKDSYLNVDLRIGSYLMQSCSAKIHAYFGVRGVDLRERLNAHIFGINNFGDNDDVFQQQKSEFGGVGPELGVGGDFCAWGGFSVLGEFGFTPLIGRRKNRINTFQGAVPGFVGKFNQWVYNTCTVVVPALDMKAAVNWTKECGCFVGSLEGGYKMAYFFKAFRQAINSNNNTETRDFGFAGPYVGLSLSY